MARPDWDRSESYPANPDEWEWRRWAWEFLRRNEKYQDECDELADGTNRAKQAMGRRWGLGDYKHFRDPYGDEQATMWLSEAFCEYEVGAPEGKEYRVTLKQNEVALVFDLNHVAVAGTSALDSLLRGARTVLKEYMAELKIEPPDVRVSRSGLFETLRAYDALVYAKASPTDVARLLRPDAFGPSGDTTSQDAARKYVNDLFERGRALVLNKGYLRLPTRDYIDDRSKVKKRASAAARNADPNSP